MTLTIDEIINTLIHKFDSNLLEMYSDRDEMELKGLVLLDDEKAISMWHAILATFFRNARSDSFIPPVSIGHFPQGLIEAIHHRKLDPNPFFDQLLETIKKEDAHANLSNVLHLLDTRMHNSLMPDNSSAAIGYHGSTIFGEWQIAYLENRHGKIDDRGVKKRYLTINLLLPILTFGTRILPSDILYQYWNHINLGDKKFHIFFTLRKNPDQKEKIKLDPMRNSTDSICITYNNDFEAILLKGHLENIIEKFDVIISLAEKRNVSEKHFTEIITEIESIQSNINSFLTFFLDSETQNNIRKIFQLWPDSDIRDEEKRLVRFLKAIQFLLLFQKIMKIEEEGIHYYFPKPPSDLSKMPDPYGKPDDKTSIEKLREEIPRIFMTFYGKINEVQSNLFFDHLDKAYNLFVNKYFEKLHKYRTNCQLKIEKRLGNETALNAQAFKLDEQAENTFYLITKLLKKLPTPSLALHVFATSILARELVNETKIESSEIEYSFILSNKENNELVLRKYGSGNLDSFDLTYYEKYVESETKSIKHVEMGLNDKIMINPKNLYSAIGLLKHHYALLNKSNVVIGILPDRNSYGISLYNVIYLDPQKLGLGSTQISKIEVLKRIQQQNQELKGQRIVGINVSTRSIDIIWEGKILVSFNPRKLKWESSTEIDKTVTDNICKYVPLKGKQYVEEISQIISQVLEKITISHKYGGIIVLTKFNDDFKKQISEGVSIPTNRILRLNDSNKLSERRVEELFDYVIMDGATIIDIDTWEVHPRVILHPLISEDEKKRSRSFDLTKDASEISQEWPDREKHLYDPSRTRHYNSIGIAATTTSLVFTISSTGKLTIFKKDKTDKVRGYSIDELKNEKP